jgi:hypothetical protein
MLKTAGTELGSSLHQLRRQGNLSTSLRIPSAILKMKFNSPLFIDQVVGCVTFTENSAWLCLVRKKTYPIVFPNSELDAS